MSSPQATTTDLVIQAIQKVKSDLTHAVTVDSTFEQLGIDSMDAIEVMFEVEERFGVSVPTDAIKSMRTVGDVVAGVQKLLAARGTEATQ